MLNPEGGRIRLVSPKPLFCVFLGKSFDTLLRVMSKTTLSHVKVRVRFSNRWLTEIGGSLTGESYPKLCFGMFWVILLSLVVGFRNMGYHWLPYHLDGIFE